MVLRNVQQHPAGAAGARSLATLERAQPRPAASSSDRAFKVLKSSHAPTQLSLFSPRGTTR